MPKEILQTSRLMLREMTLDDLDFLAELLGHPEVMRFYPKVLNRDEAALWIEKQLKRYEDFGYGFWLAICKETGQPVGQVGVLQQEIEGESLIEVGYLLHRPFWRQGFASEAAIACKQYAFESLKAMRVHSLIRPINIPSQRVAIRNGMLPIRMVSFKDYDHLLFAVDHADSPK